MSTDVTQHEFLSAHQMQLMRMLFGDRSEALTARNDAVIWPPCCERSNRTMRRLLAHSSSVQSDAMALRFPWSLSVALFCREGPGPAAMLGTVLERTSRGFPPPVDVGPALASGVRAGRPRPACAIGPRRESSGLLA